MIIAKNKTKQKSESSPVMGFQMAAVLMLLRRRQKGFPVYTQIICPHFVLGDPPRPICQSHIPHCAFRQSCTRQKGCFSGTVVLFLVDAMLGKPGKNSPSSQVGWVASRTPGWKSPLRASVDKRSRGDSQALGSAKSSLLFESGKRWLN